MFFLFLCLIFNYHLLLNLASLGGRSFNCLYCLLTFLYKMKTKNELHILFPINNFSVVLLSAVL